MEIAEERPIFGFARRGRGNAVKIGEKRIGEILSGNGIGLATENRSGRGAKIAAIRDDEKFPGGGLAAGARGGEAEVLKMKGAEKFFELWSGDLIVIAGGKTLGGAAFERIFETLTRDRPRRGRNFGVETVDKIGMRSEEARRLRGAGGGTVPSARVAT